jgi:rhodanese-related sulfurtransferase
MGNVEPRITIIMSFLKKLFKPKEKVDFRTLMSNGAIIIDVRTKGEFEMGHVKKSNNIPLDKIPSKIEKIKKLNKPVILCCASGMRSAKATRVLKNNGIEAYNGGSWRNLQFS